MTFKNILIATLITCLFAACGPKEDPITYVPGYLKQLLPYTDGQALSFSDGNGSVVNATVSVISHIVNQSSCASCTATKSEYITYDLKAGVRPFVQFSVDLRPVIFMNIASPLDNFQVGAGFDFMVVEGQPQPVCNGVRQTCVPSIVLNGRTYNNILEIISGATSPTVLTKAYYSNTQGLIGFRYGSGITYTKQ